MAKKSTLKNLVVTLGVITFLSSAAVVTVHAVTKDKIQSAKAENINSAIAVVLPEVGASAVIQKYSRFVDGDTLHFYAAAKDGKPIGTAVETFSDKGFGGRMKIMVGFLPDGTIYRTSVISHDETPGLGNKIERSKGDFSVQFDGKNPASFKLKVAKDGGDVDAITAATISSRAFCDAVQRAYDQLAVAVGSEQ